MPVQQLLSVLQELLLAAHAKWRRKGIMGENKKKKQKNGVLHQNRLGY